MGLTVEPLEGESIVCFAGEDWWYHHPHSKNHLLKRYAQRNKVLFVNSISMGLPSIGESRFLPQDQTETQKLHPLAAQGA